MTLHTPELYRYEVSRVVQHRCPRIGLNRYGRQIIGLGIVAGRFAYCIKWAWAS